MKPSQLDGFAAAAFAINEMLEDAQKNNPENVTAKMRESKSYYAGYYDGVLLSHSMLACGFFPQINKDFIHQKLKEMKGLKPCD